MSLLQSQDGITIPHSGTVTQDKGGSQLECVAALSPWVPVPSDRAPKWREKLPWWPSQPLWDTKHLSCHPEMNTWCIVISRLTCTCYWLRCFECFFFFLLVCFSFFKGTSNNSSVSKCVPDINLLTPTVLHHEANIQEFWGWHGDLAILFP